MTSVQGHNYLRKEYFSIVFLNFSLFLELDNKLFNQLINLLGLPSPNLSIAEPFIFKYTKEDL